MMSRVVSAPDFGSWGPGFDRGGIHLMTERRFIVQSFIIILPSSRYDLNTVERGVKHKTFISSSVNLHSKTLLITNSLRKRSRGPNVDLIPEYK